jgi:hypothetical protein
MEEIGESDLLIDNDGNIRYTVNANIIKWFRIMKTGYLISIIMILSILLIYEKQTYLSYITAIYINVESISVCVYLYKIFNNKGMKQCRLVSALLRVFWIIVTYYGFTNWLEDTHKESIFYYVVGYVYISNIIFIAGWSLFVCFFCCVSLQISRSDNVGEQNRRAALSIIDDISDIQIFSNILKLNVYNETVCSICLENFENDDNVRLLRCHHVYHNECIKEWFERSSKCPLCNTNVIEN